MFGKELVQQDIWLNLQKFIQVNKPASIPVHPCGRYRHNTVVFILAKVNDQLYLLLKEAWLQEHKLSLSWRSTFNIRIMARNFQIHLKNIQFEEKKHSRNMVWRTWEQFTDLIGSPQVFSCSAGDTKTIINNSLEARMYLLWKCYLLPLHICVYLRQILHAIAQEQISIDCDDKLEAGAGTWDEFVFLIFQEPNQSSGDGDTDPRETGGEK